MDPVGKTEDSTCGLPSGYVKIPCGPFPSENIKSFKEGAGTPLEKKRSGDTAETSMSQAKKKSQKKVDLRAYEYVQKSRVSIHNIYIYVCVDKNIILIYLSI